MNIPRIIASAVAGIAFLIILMSGSYTVDQGERAVVLTNGAISSISGPGFHLKLPLVQSVQTISVQVQKDAFEFKDSINDFRMQAYTKDQQPATIAMSVNYHVTDPAEVYSQYGTIQTMESKVIDPRTNEQVKNVFGQFNAIEAIQERAKLNAQIMKAITKSITGPVIVDSVQIEDISFSKSYESAVEARMQANVKQQQAEAEKQKRMIDADAAKYEKEAQADAALYTAQAEGKGITAKGDALKNNPEIVSLTTAQKWDGHLPQQMIPGSAVPFINTTNR